MAEVWARPPGVNCRCTLLPFLNAHAIGHVSDATIISPLDAEELERRLDDSPLCEVNRHAVKPCTVIAIAQVRATCPNAPAAQLVCRGWCEAFELGKEVWACPGCHRRLSACWVVTAL